MPGTQHCGPAPSILCSTWQMAAPKGQLSGCVVRGLANKPGHGNDDGLHSAKWVLLSLCGFCLAFNYKGQLLWWSEKSSIYSIPALTCHTFSLSSRVCLLVSFVPFTLALFLWKLFFIFYRNPNSLIYCLQLGTPQGCALWVYPCSSPPRHSLAHLSCSVWLQCESEDQEDTICLFSSQRLGSVHTEHYKGIRGQFRNHCLLCFLEAK